MTAREPGPHPAARRRRNDRSRQLARAARVYLAAAIGQRGRFRNVQRIQHGRRPRARGKPVLCGEHPAAAGAGGAIELAHRPSSRRQSVRQLESLI